MADYRDELLEHDHDGIKELDNFLPRWWLYLFYVSIVFSVLYMLYYHVLGIGYSQEEQYRAEMDPNYVRASAADVKTLGFLPEYHSPFYEPGADRTPRQAALAGPQKEVTLMTRETDTATYTALEDPGRIQSGKEIFMRNCAQCHGNQGEGGVGPNLTDRYWLHGATMTDVVRSVKYGYPAKGMVPWQGTISEEEIIEVSSYVLTLRGTNPPNARAPQGELVEY